MRSLWKQTIRAKCHDKESDEKSGSFFSVSSPINRKNICTGLPPMSGGGIYMNRIET